MLFLFNKKRKKTHFQKLHQTWKRRHQKLQEKLWAQHGHSLHWLVTNGKQWGATSLGGMLLLSSPAAPHLHMSHVSNKLEDNSVDLSNSTFLSSDLYGVLPKNEVRPLTDTENEKVIEILRREFGLEVSSELNGKKLNTTYGFIGAEQHLVRYPGDTMYTHFDNSSESMQYQGSGMAPGRGAWGFFANSSTEMTQEDKNREKYYIAVQTFLAPGYGEDTKSYSDFFKYRKMLVVNPQNGRAMVVDIADAGPAPWTGKQLGGSPEVMSYLQRVDGAQKGAVLYYFINDSNDSVPLGPIGIQSN